MAKMPKKTVAVLVILFFLPVLFLLFLYPSTHNYDPLNIVNEEVPELQFFSSKTDEELMLQDHITVLGFLGAEPLKQRMKN